MARLLSQTLTLAKPTSSLLSQTLTLPKPTSSYLLSRLAPLRCFSSKPFSGAAIIEINIDRANNLETEDDDDAEDDLEEDDHDDAGEGRRMIHPGLQRLEDAIDAVIAKKMAPEWLPLLPGSSYWVPPRRKLGDLLGVFGKLHEDDTLRRLRTVCGWPSATYFVDDVLPHHVEKHSKKAAAQSDDEE